MYSQKFSQFEIGHPLLMTYTDGSFIILQKISKSTAKIMILEKKQNPIFRDLKVGMKITKIHSNSTYGVILNKNMKTALEELKFFINSENCHIDQYAVSIIEEKINELAR